LEKITNITEINSKQAKQQIFILYCT